MGVRSAKPCIVSACLCDCQASQRFQKWRTLPEWNLRGTRAYSTSGSRDSGGETVVRLGVGRRDREDSSYCNRSSPGVKRLVRFCLLRDSGLAQIEEDGLGAEHLPGHLDQLEVLVAGQAAESAIGFLLVH